MRRRQVVDVKPDVDREGVGNQRLVLKFVLQRRVEGRGSRVEGRGWRGSRSVGYVRAESERERARERESEPVSTRLPTCLAHVNQPVVLAGPGEPVIPRLEVQDHVVVGNSEPKLANFHDLQVVFEPAFQFSNTTISVKFTDTTTLVVFPSRVRTRDVAI